MSLSISFSLDAFYELQEDRRDVSFLRASHGTLLETAVFGSQSKDSRDLHTEGLTPTPFTRILGRVRGKIRSQCLPMLFEHLGLFLISM